MTLPRENPSPGDYPDVYALTCEMGVTVKGQSDDDLYFNENKSFFQEVCSPCTKDIRSKQSTPFPTFPVRRYCLAGTKVRTDSDSANYLYRHTSWNKHPLGFDVTAGVANSAHGHGPGTELPPPPKRGRLFSAWTWLNH
ncbi:hypothetical protein J6590_093528 [Homalodisca vitripennis]|nr:hypothetical protein J6590_093528 [Homalodisca vitripennis]